MRVKRRLEDDSFPRIQMTIIVAVTGGFGLLASFSLLQAGIENMALRYPLALALAYLFFLFLIWLWLRTKAEDYLDVPDVSGVLPRGGAPDALPSIRSGGGGDFGGGGASGSFDGSGTAIDEAANPLGSAGEALGSVADADELAIPLVVVALAIGLALASLYVIYIAPLLFAEVLVDGALSYALLRRLRSQDPRHWLSGAFGRTVLPFVATAMFLAGAGAAMTAFAPGARSIGEVVDRDGSGR